MLDFSFLGLVLFCIFMCRVIGCGVFINIGKDFIEVFKFIISGNYCFLKIVRGYFLERKKRLNNL